MIKIKRLIFLMVIIVFCVSQITLGQQDAQYTQYMYNTFSVNPAYAGSREALSVSALHRSQWLGRDGAPNTQTFNIHSPISNKVGLGLSIVHDEIGNNTNQNTYIDGAFSYTVKTSENNNLSFGLKAGAHLLNLDFNNLRNFNGGTNIITDTDLYKSFTPNLGVGVYYYTPKYYVGVSIPNILQTEHFESSNGTDNLVAIDRITSYLIAGYVFNLSTILKFKPAFLVKATAGAPLQVDVSTNFLFNDKFSMGTAYRLDAAVSALFGFQMTNEFMLGLAYDTDISELGGARYNNGSFELFLRYEFIKKNKVDLTPRFF